MRNGSRATLFGKFESAILFGSIDGSHMMLLQVFTDFDVARRTISDVMGKGFSEEINPTDQVGTAWHVVSEKQQEYVQSSFFRPFAQEVQKKPNITKLVLMPCTLDTPMVPNDFLDRSRS